MLHGTDCLSPLDLSYFNVRFDVLDVTEYSFPFVGLRVDLAEPVFKARRSEEAIVRHHYASYLNRTLLIPCFLTLMEPKISLVDN